jgi:hypothetical protein
VVFILIALLYAGHFIINSMNSNKKKEAFTLFDDDVENYEEPSKTTIKKTQLSSTTTPEETKYDLRVLILDDIEKLQITDKDLKGKLMEIMFNEDTLKKTAIMSDNQRYDFIKNKYVSINSTNPSEKSSFTDTDENKSEDAPKKPLSNINSPISQELILMTADTMTKLQTVQTNLQVVQNSITDVQKYAAKIDSSTSKIDIESKSGFTMPKIPEPFVIEGFENIKGFASAF